MSTNSSDISISVDQFKQSDFVFKYLDLLNNSDFLLNSNVSILTALSFLSQCFDKNEELGFSKLSDGDQTSVINILISLINSLENIYLNEMDQSILDQNNKYFNDIAQTLFVLTNNSNQFIEKFNKTSEKSIESILSLLHVFSKIKTKDTKIAYSVKNLLEVLVCMSLFHEKYEINWKNANQLLEGLKHELNFFDEKIDSKWLLFKIVENLKTTQYFIDNSFNFLKYKNNEIALKIGLNFLDYLETATNVCENFNFTYFLSFVNSIDEGGLKIEIDRKKIVDFYVKLADKIFNALIELIKELNQDKNNQEILTKIRNKFSYICNVNVYLVKFFDRLIEYSNFFHQNPNGLSILFNFLDNDLVVDFYINSRSYFADNYDLIICMLYNLSRLQHKYMDEWNAHDPVNKCLKFLEKTGADFELMIYLIVANIASDDQIETLPQLKEAIGKISEIIKECVDALDDENCIRHKVFKYICFLKILDICLIGLC